MGPVDDDATRAGDKQSFPRQGLGKPLDAADEDVRDAPDVSTEGRRSAPEVEGDVVESIDDPARAGDKQPFPVRKALPPRDASGESPRDAGAREATSAASLSRSVELAAAHRVVRARQALAELEAASRALQRMREALAKGSR